MSHRRLALLLVLAGVVVLGVGCGEQAGSEADVPKEVAAAIRAGATPYEAWSDYAIESEARRLGLTVTDEEIDAENIRFVFSHPDDEVGRSDGEAAGRAAHRLTLLLEKIARHPDHYGESFAEDPRARWVQLLRVHHELLARVWPDGTQPPAQQPDSTVDARASLKVHENELLLVVTKQGCAAIDFLDFGGPDDAVEYRWRYTPMGKVAEQSGSGFVREAYDRVRSVYGGYELHDLGSQLLVQAGPIVVEWSFGSDDSGWVYYDSHTTALSTLPDASFDDLDLREHLPKQDK